MVLGVGGEDLPVDMPESWQQREQLVSFLYDREYGHGRNIRGAGGGQSGRSGNSSGDRSGGSGESALNVPDWINGIHHGVSRQHLQAYLNEFTFRFNRRFYPFNAFRSLLGIAGNVSAPTFDELYSGKWEHPTCCG